MDCGVRVVQIEVIFGSWKTFGKLNVILDVPGNVCCVGGRMSIGRYVVQTVGTVVRAQVLRDFDDQVGAVHFLLKQMRKVQSQCQLV